MNMRALGSSGIRAAATLCFLAAAAAGCAGPAPGEDAPRAAPASAHKAAAAAPAALEAGGDVEPGEIAFFDGERRVRAARLGPRSGGGALSALSLRYGGGRAPAPALVGKGAIVEVGDIDDDDELASFFAEIGVRAVRPLMRAAGLWLVEDEGEGDGLDVAARLSERSRAESAGSPRRGLRQAVPDLYLRHSLYGEPFTPNDPRFPGQWFFKNLKMTEAWSYSKGDAKTTVVVIDSGCDMGHPELAAKMDPGRDVIDSDDDPSFTPGSQNNAHGTACAGLIGAVTNNGEGIAGACPECRLRCVRLIDDVAVPVSADVEAFTFVLDTGAAVASNSWGYTDPIPVPKPLATAINKVFDTGRGGLGALVLFAAGNDDREVEDDELLGVRGVLGVGAINNFDEETVFTNSGNSVDLVAPTGTLSIDISGPDGYDPDDYTSSFGGTSSACPVAAGIAGLLVSAAPQKTSAEIVEVLLKTARPAPYAVPDANGHDPVFGYGIIDPVRSLESVLGIEEPKDAGPPSDAGAPPKEPAEPEPSGCDCSTLGFSAEPGAAALAAILGGVGYAARRRRRRASA